MSPQKPTDPLKFEAHIDGVLPDRDRESIQAEIAASPQLQVDVELQTKIDDSLRRVFGPNAPSAALLEQLRKSAVKEEVTRNPLRRFVLTAAAIAATIVWGMLGWQFFTRPSWKPDYDPNKPLELIYATQVEEGFKPIWVCNDDREFASTFQKRQGQPLLLGTLPPGSKMEGLTYCGGMSRYTTTMLARVDGLPVMVFVDRAEADSHPALPTARSKLHLFRKELGPLVLYELTSQSHPSVMDHLHLADEPATK